MRKALIVLGAAGCAMYWAAPVAGWWAQPIAVFLGRREFWWDAEDFAVFYAAGTLVTQGHVGALYDPSAHAAIQLPLLVQHDEPLGFYNPPLFALVFAPLSWLPFDVAFRVWTFMGVVLLGGLCALVWRIAAPLDRTSRVILMAAFLTMYPLPFGLRLGQFSLILAASWTLAYVLLRDGRPRAAGAALTPLLIKPELLIPITALLLWKRQWDTLSVLLPVSAAAVVLSVAMVGPAGAWDYSAHVMAAAADGTGNMYGWNGLLASVFAPDDPGSMARFAIPLSLLTLGIAAMAFVGRLDVSGRSFPRLWLMLTLATVLWDLHFYLQDLILVGPAAVAAFAATEGRYQAFGGGALAAGWLILGFGSVPSAIWGFNIFAAYMAATLLALAAWELAARLRGRDARMTELRAEPALERAA